MVALSDKDGIGRVSGLAAAMDGGTGGGGEKGVWGCGFGGGGLIWGEELAGVPVSTALGGTNGNVGVLSLSEALAPR